MIGKELKFLVKHSSIYGIGTVVSQAVGFFLLPLYTNYLTPADYGVMSLINVTVDIVGLIVTLGVVNAMSRFYFDYDDPRKQNLVVSTVYWIFVILAVFFIPLLYLLSVPFSEIIFQSKGYENHFMVAFLGLFFGALVDIGLTYLRIKAYSVKFVQISLARTIILIGLNIYFVAYIESGVIGIFYSTLITALIFSLVLSIPILVNVKTKFSYHLAKEMTIFSFPLIFSNMFRIVINQSDKYFINYFFSPFETGIYSIAQKIGQSIHSLITSPFLQIYIPRRFEIMKRDDAKTIYSSILIYFTVILGTIGLLLSMYSHEIISIMTTAEYYRTVKYIPLVVFSMIIFGLKYHFEIGIMIYKKTKYVAYINGVSALLNIILNYILIKNYTLWGALIASNISIFVTTALNYIFSQKLYNIDFKLTKVYKYGFLVVLCYFISTYLNVSNLYIAVPLKFVLAIFYIASIFAFGILDNKNLSAIKRQFFQLVRKQV